MWDRTVRACTMAAVSVATVACGDASEVERQRRVWQSHSIDDYVFVYEKTCFCLPGEPLRIVVAGDEIAHVERAVTGRPADHSEATTIEALFDSAARSESNYPDGFEARYDEQYGFPVSVTEDRGGEDDWSGFRVTCFSPYVTEDACPITRLSRAECVALGAVVVNASSSPACLDFRLPLGRIDDAMDLICCPPR